MMKQVEDKEQLLELLRSKFLPKLQSNASLHPQNYQDDLREGSLYYSQEGECLLLYRKRKEHYITTYYSLDLPVFPDCELALVVEVPFQKKALDVSWWQEKGFDPQVSRQQYALPDEQGVACNRATMEQLDKVTAFLAGNFAVATGCHPLRSRLVQDITEGKVLCEMDGGRLLGLLRYGVQDKVATILHLAVAESHRGKGVAKQLYDGFLSDTNGKLHKVFSGSPEGARFYEKQGGLKTRYQSLVLEKKGITQ
ncbi:MAG: GNAT family N-acetyltransferase [Eubacteriales bacterium]